MRRDRPAGLRGELAVIDQAIEYLNVLAEDGVVGQHHLEAVELGRIMRAGDLNAAIHR